MKMKMIDEMTIQEFLQWIIDYTPEGFGHSSLSHFLYEIKEGAVFHLKAIAEHEQKQKSRIELIETNDGKWFEQNLNGYLGEGWKIITANIYPHQFGTMYSALIELPTSYQPTEKGEQQP